MAGAVGAVAAAACGPSRAQGALADDGGRRLSIAATPRRVFPAGGPASVFVYCLAPDRLLGWTRALRADEAAFLLTEVAALPELGRLTGRGSTAALEAVLAMRAELIVDVGSTAATYVSLADQVQRQTGVPYLLLDGAFDRTESTIRRLGQVLGVTARAERLARGTRAILDAAAELRAGLRDSERPRVFFARGPTGLATAADGGLNAEVLAQVGALNVARVEAPNLALISLEQVTRWQPDWILASDAAFFAQVHRHPVWSKLPAVRARRVLLIPRVPFGWFDAPPALNRLIGIEWLSAVLHPQRTRYRLDERLSDTFEWLYHRRPSIGQMRALLAATR
ncbi:MAG TPA: ABC transporter substrate-binding protein [Zeimonas sp.]|nr:ABC transporter substrate-binding protein [Zeimonas sp.]